MGRALVFLFLSTVFARADVLVQLTEPQRQAAIQCIVKGVSGHPELADNCGAILGMIAAAPALVLSKEEEKK